jgi:outer membrane protein assembly factor BamB
VIGSPVAYGNFVFLATDENRIYGLQQRDSLINMTVGLGETITTPPAVGLPPGSDTAVLVVATADGMVHGYNALNTGPELWAYPVGARVSAPLLIVDGVVYAGAEDGRLHAFDLGGGAPLWIYPAGEPAGSFETAAAFDGGIIYIGDADGDLHLVNADSGEPACTSPVPMIGGAIGTNPMVADGVVFVSLGIGGIPVFEAGSCGIPPDGYASQYPAPPSNGLAPAMGDAALYLLEGRRLVAYLLEAALWVEGETPSPWTSPFVADDFITTPPIVAGGVINVGSQGGTVYGVDAATGGTLWSFSTGSAIRGEPVSVPGAVFVATAAGEVWAIAGD